MVFDTSYRDGGRVASTTSRSAPIRSTRESRRAPHTVEAGGIPEGRTRLGTHTYAGLPERQPRQTAGFPERSHTYSHDRTTKSSVMRDERQPCHDRTVTHPSDEGRSGRSVAQNSCLRRLDTDPGTEAGERARDDCYRFALPRCQGR